MRLITLANIQNIVNQISLDELVAHQELGFIAYSQGQAVVPPVGHLKFQTPPGDCHIKYGYLQSEKYFVVKIATGFYQNVIHGLSPGDGAMLLFNQQTGILEAILIDNGFLTDLRTALAGLIVAKYLAPGKISSIGIVGTGKQAELQPIYLKSITNCRDLIVHGRNSERMEIYKQKMQNQGFTVHTSKNISGIVSNCNLIITATASTEPLLTANSILPGTHITALGSDGSGKQELEPELLHRADLIVVDSIVQCLEYGETHFAIEKGLIHSEQLLELGTIISADKQYRTNDKQITIADLTGIAVQDIQIASMIYREFCQQQEYLGASIHA